MRAPEQCQTMQELRGAIDALDKDLITLLTRRAAYIDRAIVLKQNEKIPARAQDRVIEVLTHVRSIAEAGGLDGDLAETVWTELIEWSIAREEVVLGQGPDGEGT